MSVRWQIEVEARLRGAEAPRVLTTAAIEAMAQAIRPVSDRSVGRWIREAVTLERLVPVSRGLFLNQLCSPKAAPEEAIAHLFPNAVVSLERRLGQVGVVNNPTPVITATVPYHPDGARPSAGRFEPLLGEVHIRVLPERIFYAGEVFDRLERDLPYPAATPEKALIEWLYLGHSPRSTLTPPPGDLDLEDLDQRRLARLAEAAGVEQLLEATWRQARSADKDPDGPEPPF